MEKCGIEDLHLFLVLNDFYISVYDDEGLINVCADIFTFGLPEKCQKCFNGDMVFSKYGYTCNAMIDDWVKCGHFETKPKRKACIIPDDLKGNKYFKMFKPHIEDRVLRTKCTDASHFQETSLTEHESNQTNEIIYQIKQGAVVDLQFDLYCSSQVHRDANSTYSCMLVLVDIEQNKNSYFKLQVIESDNLDYQRLLMESKIPCFHLFTSWGRIGTTIGKSNVKAFQSVDLAIAEFKKVYKEKTGSDWNKNKKLVKILGKFFLADVDYSINKQLFELIQMISPKSDFGKQIRYFKIDLHRWPLGKLSFQQLEKAEETLFDIEKAIQAESSKSLLIGLSNKFFSMVPHNFGLREPHILDSISKVNQKKVLMESLIEIEKDYTENQLKPFRLNADIEALDQDSEQYNLIETYIQNTSVHGYKLMVIDIFKVQRHEEIERYKPYKNFANRQLLWHGSCTENFESIIKNGLRASKRRCLFGQGIYFADVASKSANYCQGQHIKLLALCEVALGNIYESTNPNGIYKPPSNFNSIKVPGTFQPDITQALFIDDGVLVTLGIPKITQDEYQFTRRLNYNEYIVNNEAQVTLKYLVKFKN